MENCVIKLLLNPHTYKVTSLKKMIFKIQPGEICREILAPLFKKN